MRRRPELGWLTARPIAHRGLHDRPRGIVENTASAFAAAADAGYAIECDLQLTDDGEAVVFHDDHLERLTLGGGRVIENTTSQMKSLQIRDSTDRVQTLSELLEQIGGRVPLLIELKSLWDGNRRLARRAAEVLSNYTGKFALMSFDPDLIETIRNVAPSMPRGMIVDRAFDGFYDRLPAKRRIELRSLTYLRRTEPDFLSCYFRELPYAPVTALRQKGMPVAAWTIRSPQEQEDALRYCDQITFENFRPEC